VNDSGVKDTNATVSNYIKDTRIAVYLTNTGQPTGGTFSSLDGACTLDAEL
jgi:hypothetical protein